MAFSPGETAAAEASSPGETAITAATSPGETTLPKAFSPGETAAGEATSRGENAAAIGRYPGAPGAEEMKDYPFELGNREMPNISSDFSTDNLFDLAEEALGDEEPDPIEDDSAPVGVDAIGFAVPGILRDAGRVPVGEREHAPQGKSPARKRGGAR